MYMKNKPISYEIMKKDFMYINMLLGIIGFITFGWMLLQKWGVMPSMPCPLHELFHLYCPGCGGTRAIFAFLQGKFWESLCLNPAIILGILLILHYEIGVILTLVKKNGKRYYCNSMIPAILYLIIVIIFAIVRNYLLIECGVDMLQDFIH